MKIDSSTYARLTIALLVLGLPVLCRQAPDSAGILDDLRRAFAAPPDDARIMMRWWWFGSAVVQPELERELQVMKAAGIGGVEIQPVYPLELDDPQRHIRNLPYLSDEFLRNVRFTAEKAEQLGLRVDVTLGSGWPYGGPRTPVTEAAGRLRCERVTVVEGEHSAPLPALENGERLLSIFLVKGECRQFTPEGAQYLTKVENSRVQLPDAFRGPHVLLFFIASRTGQQVKRAAVGAEGFVLDHYSRLAVEHHLASIADPLLQIFGSRPPHAVFSDSLEVFSSDWTDDLLPEFQKRRGYALEPHLPELVADGPQSAAVRHDWGKTLTELAEERYLTPIRDWAHAHGTLFRSQTYGEPPVILSSNKLVDLPEGEAGPKWRTFSAARWASSASHIYGRPVTSTETWTWLHSPAFRATPLDMKAEADLHFLEGINQLIGHGWPYSPESAGEPGWRFYAAAALNEHNPWFQVMPEITRYLQRLSFLLRQGQPANDIAIYLPTDDAWANFKLGKASVDKLMETLLGPALIPQVLNAGYNFDFVDDRAIEKNGLPWKLMIVPGVERIPLRTLQRLQAYRRSGGILVATRKLPSRAPGLLENETETPEVAALARELFQNFVSDENTLGTTLTGLLPPDLAVSAAAAPAIGFIHRKLPNADVYFIANTSSQIVQSEVKFRTQAQAAELWDPFTGQIRSTGMPLSLQLAPYESRVIVISSAFKPVKIGYAVLVGQMIPLDTDWKITFMRTGRTSEMAKLHSWADDEDSRYYSGDVAYEKIITLLKAPKHALIDFGEGQGVPPTSLPGAPGMRALLESPVRESAVVFINNQRAGTIWHPPYQLDLTRFLHIGKNQLRIVVANTAINEIAGHALPNYRLLNLRYGERFTPQGFEQIAPLPSGLLGPVQLHVE